MRQREMWTRVGLCAATIVLLLVAARSWSPPFPHRSGYIPAYDIPARTSFTLRAPSRAEEVYAEGDILAHHGRPLSAADVQRLHAEHIAARAEMVPRELLWRGVASAGILILLMVICGWYLQVNHRSLWGDRNRLALLLGAVVMTVAAATVLSRDAWRAESIPLIVFGLSVAIVFDRPLALLLSAAVGLVVALALGQGLPECLLLVTSVVIPTLMLDRVRIRTKLIYIGAVSGAVVFVAALCVSGIEGQAFGASHSGYSSLASEGQQRIRDLFAARAVAGAGWYGLCVVLAGFLMTGLLPFLERVFDVHTDIRLLELGDAAHPLLQQLAQRAPGTYNHSINVASIGEAAAEAIGGNGLLVRVGAYFHDIGKMFKPEYFIENQSVAGNSHDSLVPAMSTLVIIAHVKDGVNLARQHRLPRSIIAFIEQHHGSTLVEYFFRQASLKREGGPDGPQVDENNFRYPGPKPQTSEAAVLMMADAVESACRALTDPTPARIENLVHEIALKRLMDGQFEECELTLRELNTIEDSLVKSLTAVYHGRIKYPSQQTA